MENTACIKKIYLVGGAVRDKLLGLVVQDKDYVAVGYTQNDFSHLKKVGKNFPVFLLSDSSQIALARRESKVSQGYNGFSYEVENVSLKEDLKRRDLTINAMAFDEEKGEIIDYFHGREDLENKLLRHVSLAFCEDPLRVLRIARFRARLGEDWQITKETKDLIFSMKKDLKFLEKNRIYKEILEVLKLQRSDLFFRTLFDLAVLDAIFPLIYSLNFFNYKEQNAFIFAMNLLKKVGICENILKFSILYLNLIKEKNQKTMELDIQIPKKILKNIEILIINHKKNPKSPQDFLEYLEVYFDDESLLLEQKSLNLLDETSNLDFKLLEKMLIEVKKVSPRKWIENQKTSPKGSAIKEYIHKERLAKISAFI